MSNNSSMILLFQKAHLYSPSGICLLNRLPILQVCKVHVFHRFDALAAVMVDSIFYHEMKIIGFPSFNNSYECHSIWNIVTHLRSAVVNTGVP